MFAPPLKAPEATTASPAPPAHAAQPLRHRTAGTPASFQRSSRGPSWDFGKIRLFAPDRPSGPEARPMLLQRKLAVGQVDDPLEHEADCVAEQVMRTPPASTTVGGSLLRIQRFSG